MQSRASINHTTRVDSHLIYTNIGAVTDDQSAINTRPHTSPLGEKKKMGNSKPIFLLTHKKLTNETYRLPQSTSKLHIIINATQ